MKIVFHKNKQKFCGKKLLIPFFGCKLAFVLQYKLYEKKNYMQNLTFCVYKVVQDAFFTQKIQKSRESVFFCKHDYYLLFHLQKKIILEEKQAFFLNHQNFQAKSYLAIFKKLLFWYINPCENVKINVYG